MSEIIKDTYIKCDNAQCDYRHDGIKVSEMPEWVDRPCPKCGENLLTHDDFNGFLGLMHVAKWVEEMGMVDNTEDTGETFDLNYHNGIHITKNG